MILDVVYNHTGEGDQTGPTFSFRGFDNQAYYRLMPDNPRYYINDTGTGNTLNIDHPMVLRMVMDSLRYWVEVMGVDGFRFDLCATLGRTPSGFDPGASFFRRAAPGSGAIGCEADRRALGYRARRLPAWRIPTPVSRMERHVSATVCGGSGAAMRGMVSVLVGQADRLGGAVRPFRPPGDRIGQFPHGP